MSIAPNLENIAEKTEDIWQTKKKNSLVRISTATQS
jgi:hypothetical protein